MMIINKFEKIPRHQKREWIDFQTIVMATCFMITPIKKTSEKTKNCFKKE
jgi:hypothetical protein